MSNYIKGKDGKFAGSVGDGKVAVPAAAPDAPRRVHDIPGNEEFARLYETTYDTFLRMTQPHPEDRNPGAHPVYGGHNWGIQYSSEWDDWSVNHGYYGMSQVDESTGKVYIDGSDTPLKNEDVRWTSDAKTEEFAQLIWEHREHITEGLHAAGFHPARGVRIRVTLNSENGNLDVAPYDNPNDFEAFSVRL